VVEVTRSLSNLIKSGFVAFSQNDTLVIDANENKIIKAIDAEVEDKQIAVETSVEEALAEALILDAELEGADFDGTNLLTMDTSEFSKVEQTQSDAKSIADMVVREARLEADAIIAKAHDEAEQMRAEDFDEVEQIKSQAQEEGYQIGYEEAMLKAQQEISHKEADLEQRLLDNEIEFKEKETRLVKETECQMVDLLCRLIPSITGVVIESQRDVLLYMINSAMHDLDNSKQFVVKVSSEDYSDLVERKSEIYGALNPAIDLEIFEDAKLESMQCLIETENGIVDVSLDVQLDNLITALKLMVIE